MVNIEPGFAGLMVIALRSWLSNPTQPPNLTSNNSKLQLLISKQAQVGWYHLLFGQFVHEWREIQDEYLDQQQLKDSKTTGSL